MRVLATIAIATATLFILSGCGEEEKKREKLALMAEVQNKINSEVSAQVAQQMREQLPAAVEAKLRELQEEYARRSAEAQKVKDEAAKAGTPTSNTGTKPAGATKKKSH